MGTHKGKHGPFPLELAPVKRSLIKGHNVVQTMINRITTAVLQVTHVTDTGRRVGFSARQTCRWTTKRTPCDNRTQAHCFRKL